MPHTPVFGCLLFAIVLPECLGSDLGQPGLVAQLLGAHRDESALQFAKNRVLTEGKYDDVALAKELAEVWTAPAYDYQVRFASFEVACSKAGIRSLPTLLQYFRAWLGKRDPNDVLVGAGLAGVLVKRIPPGAHCDPRLIDFLREHGFVKALMLLDCPPKLVRAAIMRSLSTDSDWRDDEVWSLACYVDDEGVPQLLKLTSNLVRDHPGYLKTAVGLRTLVELERPEAGPLLERYDELPIERAVTREELSVWRARFRAHNDEGLLLRLVADDCEPDVVRYAVWRLLWLRVEVSAIVERAIRNQCALANSSRLRRWLLRIGDYPRREPPDIVFDHWNLMPIDGLSLSELLEWCTPDTNRSPAEASQYFRRMSLPSILERR